MKKISIISMCYLLNSFFPTLLMFLYFFLGDFNKASQLALISSFVIVLLQIFSSNKRNLILTTNNQQLVINTFIFRIFFLIPAFSIYFFYLKHSFLLNINNIVLFFLFSSLWINEIVISSYELDQKKKSFIYLIFLILFFYISLILDELIKLNYFKFFVPIFIFLLFVPYLSTQFFQNFKLLKLNFINIFRIFYENLLSPAFFSSFAFLISVFVWRFFLIEFLTEKIAIYYFVIFALASFPSTFLNNFLGITILKENKKIFMKLFFILLIFILIIFFLFTFFNFEYLNQISVKYNFLNNLILFSLFGSLLMFPAMYFRLKTMFFAKQKINKLFAFDVFYGISMSLIVPLVGYNFSNFLHFSYFIGSLFSILFYFCVYKFLVSKLKL